MKSLEKLKCFWYFYYPNQFKNESIYKYASLRIIFEIEKQNLRNKERLVVGGHTINLSMYNACYSNVRNFQLNFFFWFLWKINWIVCLEILFQKHHVLKISVKNVGQNLGRTKDFFLEIMRAFYGLPTVDV